MHRRNRERLRKKCAAVDLALTGTDSMWAPLQLISSTVAVLMVQVTHSSGNCDLIEHSQRVTTDHCWGNITLNYCRGSCLSYQVCLSGDVSAENLIWAQITLGSFLIRHTRAQKSMKYLVSFSCIIPRKVFFYHVEIHEEKNIIFFQKRCSSAAWEAHCGQAQAVSGLCCHQKQCFKHEQVGVWWCEKTTSQ